MAIAQVPIDDYIGMQVLKPMRVGKQSDDLWQFSQGTFFTAAAQAGRELYLVGPGAPYPRIDYDVSTTDAYRCRKYGLEIVCPDEEDANYDSPEMHRAVKASIVLMNLLSAHEQRCVTLLTDVSTTFASYTATPTAKWDADGADPFADRITAVESMKGGGNYNPRVNDLICVIGEAAWLRCQRNEAVIGRMKHVRDALVTTEEDWQKYLQVDKFLVHRGTYNTAKPGQDVSISDMWPDYIGFYSAPKDGPTGSALPAGVAPGLGRSFIWPGPNNGDGETGYMTKRYRDETIDSWIVKGNHHTDVAVWQARAGYVFTDVSAAT